MALAQLTAGVIWGIVAHQTSPIFDRLNMGEDTEFLSRCVVGVAFTLPVFVFFRRNIIKDSYEAKKDSFAFIVSFVAVGAGVAMGRVLDKIKE